MGLRESVWKMKGNGKERREAVCRTSLLVILGPFFGDQVVGCSGPCDKGHCCIQPAAVFVEALGSPGPILPLSCASPPPEAVLSLHFGSTLLSHSNYSPFSPRHLVAKLQF